ncbi:MAG TPA: glycosyltransferase family 4 protein [Ilumatobacteraceae bacterium]|nr:glycosyltransferase family 4 protein [Ilumatobacteraceae bacterium]
MTRLLFVCRRAPWPLDNGARIRSHRLVEGLARSFETTLLTMRHHAGSADGDVDVAALRAALPDVDVRVVEGLGPSKRWDQLRSLGTADSWSFGRYATARLRDEITVLAHQLDADVVHADDLGAALALPDRAALPPSALVVYSSHNVESRIVAGDAAASRGPRRIFAANDARKLRREERAVWNAVDLVLAVSEHDADIIRRETPVEVDVCPNGTDPVEPTPRVARDGEDVRLLFVGSGSYAPYERGLAWFGREVMPELRGRRHVVFDVVGRPPRHAPSAPEIVHRGRVDELRPWYDAADAVVVPVFEGSGTRLKLVEAAAHGRPIITTALGAQGLPLEPDVHYLRAETPSEFVAAIDRVAAGAASTEELVERARHAVAPLMWSNISATLSQQYLELLETRREAAR